MTRPGSSVEAVTEALGITLTRRFEHGAGGTSLISRDGRPAVLKAWPRSPERDRILDRGLRHARIMADRGVPVPGLLERGATAGHSFLIYEYVDGQWPPTVDRRLADALVAVVDLERDAASAPDPDWARTVARMITVGDPSLDLRPARLRGHPRGDRILDDARRALAGCDPESLRGSDVLHGDFAPENVLARDGRIAAVVDWEQSRPGDATLDLVGMQFDIALGDKAAPAVWDHLDRLVADRAPADALRLYTGVYAIRYASWAIGTELESDVLSTAERLLAATGA